MTLEHKFVPMGKPIVLENGVEISGYASRFDQLDQGGDVVAGGAFSAALEKLQQTGRRVKMLWQHDPTQPIGVWDEVYEDAKGLWVRGRILKDVEKGREAVSLIEAGAIDGLSIGYRTVRAQKAKSGGRLLLELELWEVSLVTFPMLPEARVGVKGDDPLAKALQHMTGALETARAALRRA